MYIPPAPRVNFRVTCRIVADDNGVLTVDRFPVSISIKRLMSSSVNDIETLIVEIPSRRFARSSVTRLLSNTFNRRLPLEPYSRSFRMNISRSAYSSKPSTTR